MTAHLHHYQLELQWTGNTGRGTKSYVSYERSYTWHSGDKPKVEGSSDPKFRGDPGKHNPEELLLAALSSCHMLWYLHLCAESHITVLDYRDQAIAEMEGEQPLSPPVDKDNEQHPAGPPTGSNPFLGGHFVRAVLRPVIKLTSEKDRAKATALHHEAHLRCFIANSVNFPVEIAPVFESGC